MCKLYLLGLSEGKIQEMKICFYFCNTGGCSVITYTHVTRTPYIFLLQNKVFSSSKLKRIFDQN